LHTAVGRDREVDRLGRLLAGADHRPLAIVGPRLVGKTTVLHECVRRRVARRGKPYAARHNVWLLSPGRLISGMMYVGQWEGRMQAILRTARKRKHVLYFDDFLGLYEAGISRDAKLSVADLLKPFILRREVRVLAEMTPEAWQALQDRDRGLADQFHVLPIDAMSEEQTREIMLEVHRELENTHRSKFDLETLPTIMQLNRSYVRDAAFPGKAAAFSRQLAQKYAAAPITRADVYQEFHVRTGLALGLLDQRYRLDRTEVVRQLRQKVVGQTEAVEAAADVVAVAKARLNDPARPLATYLFLGPTGVGKTQCAKALAEVMFSDAKRLLRFDMNEFVTPHAAAGLVGTFGEPEGLLTSAVRRQPFSVVLLDEIEKAHPDVFDLLLQVLGEGRLTDALGRTADFSNAVIVMTSNLGTKAGRQSIGLAPSAVEEARGYVKAAERFFRPEFFNRIDRIVPFRALERDEMRRIADMLLADVFRRDGLVRRRCALAVETQAMERIVDAGYHPQFGARALKRSIERQLVQPVAAKLSGVKPELPAVVRVYPHPDGVAAVVEPLESVPAVESGRFAEWEPAEQLARIRRFVNRLRDEIEARRPPKSAASDGISAEQLRHYALVEQLRLVRERADRLDDALESSSRSRRGPEISPKASAGKMIIRAKTRIVPQRRILLDIQAAHDIHDYLRETTTQYGRPEEMTRRLESLREEAALLNLLHVSAGTPDRALLLVDGLVRDDRQWEYRLVGALGEFFERLDYGYRRLVCGIDGVARQALLVSGPGIWPLARAEAGVHFYCRRHENLLPIQVTVLPAAAGDGVERQIDEWYAARRRWLTDLAAGRASTTDDSCRLGAIVRFYDEAGATLDLRTGRSLPRFPTADEWKSLVLGGLPLPAEWEAP
jgi:ATP-dependent Clp protease ATP-binding subunit ClpC